MTLPTRTGTLSVKSTGSGAASIDISGISNGSWMIVTIVEGNTTTGITPPAWTTLLAATTIGSRRYRVLGRIKQSGDTLSVTKGGSLAVSMSVVYGTGADPVADWQIGTGNTRAGGAPSTSTTSVAPSITTTESDVLAIAIAVEATSAEDTTPPALSGTGWNAWDYVGDTASPDTTNIEQINVAYKTMAAAGATGNATYTYQNSQASNGGGIQIGITPSTGGNAAPTAAFTHIEDDLDVDVDGTTSTDSDGTIVTYSWDWGDGSSDDTGSTQSHSYTTGGTYTITLTVTDDDGATDDVTHDVTVSAASGSPVRVGALSQKSSGSTAGSITTSGIADGSWMILVGHAGDNTTTLTTPAGWTLLLSPSYTIGSRRFSVWGKIKDSGDTTVSVAKSGSLALTLGLEYGTGAAAVNTWQVGTPFNRAGGSPNTSTTNVALSITTTVANTLAYAIFCEATSAEDTVAPSLSGSGWTAGSYVTDTASPDTTNIEQINFAYKDMISTGATGNATFTYQNAQAANAGAIQIGLKPGGTNANPDAAFTWDATGLVVDVDGTTSTDSDGTIASYSWDWGDGTTDDTGSTQTHTYAAPGSYVITLTVTDDDGGIGVTDHTASVTELPKLLLGEDILTLRLGDDKVDKIYLGDDLVQQFSYTTTDMLLEPEIQVAWRGLGNSYDEMTMAGYAAAVAAGFKILECSINYSSDGVPVLIHDDTVDRITNGTGTVASKSWATLQALTVDTATPGDGVLHRLEEVLDLYAQDFVIFVDDKTNTHAADLMSLVATYPNATQHIVWKGFRGWTPAADLWTAAGYETWGIYYDDEMGTFAAPHASVSHFSMLGLNWDASAANWTQAVLIRNGQSKRLLGHVIHNSSDATVARSRGADGLMTGVVL